MNQLAHDWYASARTWLRIARIRSWFGHDIAGELAAAKQARAWARRAR